MCRVARDQRRWIMGLVGIRETMLVSGKREEESLVFACGRGRSCGLLRGLRRRE